jgi:hypothetical protein
MPFILCCEEKAVHRRVQRGRHEDRECVRYGSKAKWEMRTVIVRVKSAVEIDLPHHACKRIYTWPDESIEPLLPDPPQETVPDTTQLFVTTIKRNIHYFCTYRTESVDLNCLILGYRCMYTKAI